jgi:hypothetical protein
MYSTQGSESREVCCVVRVMNEAVTQNRNGSGKSAFCFAHTRACMEDGTNDNLQQHECPLLVLTFTRGRSTRNPCSVSKAQDTSQSRSVTEISTEQRTREPPKGRLAKRTCVPMGITGHASSAHCVRGCVSDPRAGLRPPLRFHLRTHRIGAACGRCSTLLMQRHVFFSYMHSHVLDPEIISNKSQIVQN